MEGRVRRESTSSEDPSDYPLGIGEASFDELMSLTPKNSDTVGTMPSSPLDWNDEDLMNALEDEPEEANCLPPAHTQR